MILPLHGWLSSTADKAKAIHLFIVALAVALSAGALKAAELNITEMTITGGTFGMGAPGTDVISAGDEAPIVMGTYQGVPSDTAAGSLATFVFGVFGPVGAYTADNLLGAQVSVDGGADENPAAPTGTVDDVANTISVDLGSWFAFWNGNSFNQGNHTVTGTYDPATGAYDISWQSLITGGAFDGQTGFWNLTGVATVEAPPTGPVDLTGTVEISDGTPLCSMVLASGQFMFTCNPNGPFSLTDLPRETDGTVKRQVYVDGFFPNIDVLPDSVDEIVVMTRSGTCPSYNTPYDPAVTPGSAGNRIDISGSVLLQDTQTPICAMVLANGQFMFSCDGSGSYALNIPLDTNGQFKLQVYADGFAPTIQFFDEFQPINDVGMARAAECL